MNTTPSSTSLPDTQRYSYSWLIALLIVWGLITVFFWPLLQTFPSSFIPSYYPDALEFIWTTWRIEQVLSGTKPLYYAPELFAPSGASLLLHTVCEGILVPVTGIFSQLSPAWRINAACILLLCLNAASGLSLFRTLGCRAVHACFLTLLVVFSPFTLGHLHAGHLNFLVLFPLLEAFRGACIYSSLTSQTATLRSTTALRYAGAISLLAFTNLYFLYFSGLVSVLCALYAAMRSLPSAGGLFSRFLTPLIPFCLGLVPAIAHLTLVARITLSGTYTPNHNPAKHAADLAAFITTSPVQALGSYGIGSTLRTTIALHAGESSLYLGLALSILALIACYDGTTETKRRARFFICFSLFFLIVSLGPHIVWKGVKLCPNPVDWLLRSTLPMYPSVPARFAGITIIALIAAASQGFACRRARLPRYAHSIVLIIACIEFLPSHLRAHPLPEPSPALSRLAKESKDIIVADISISQQSAMFRQTIHGKPMIGGFLSRQPRRASAQLRRNRFIQALRGRNDTTRIEAIRGWCSLGANTLILERPSFALQMTRLAELGFIQRDSDQYVVILDSPHGICSKSE